MKSLALSRQPRMKDACVSTLAHFVLGLEEEACRLSHGVGLLGDLWLLSNSVRC